MAAVRRLLRISSTPQVLHETKPYWQCTPLVFHNHCLRQEFQQLCFQTTIPACFCTRFVSLRQPTPQCQPSATDAQLNMLAHCPVMFADDVTVRVEKLTVVSLPQVCIILSSVHDSMHQTATIWMVDRFFFFFQQYHVQVAVRFPNEVGSASVAE